MTIDQLIKLTEARLANLHSVKLEAERIGDIEASLRYQADIETTEGTLTMLRSLA